MYSLLLQINSSITACNGRKLQFHKYMKLILVEDKSHNEKFDALINIPLYVTKIFI